MAVKSRNEVPERDKWRLEDMFESDSLWEDSFAELNDRIGELTDFQGKLAGAPSVLKHALDLQAELSLNAEKLYVYAHMKRDEDNSNSLYQGLADRSMALLVEMSSAASFVVPEILEIDESVLKSWIALDEFSKYRHMLGDLLRSKKHVLSKPEEKLLAMAGEIGSAPQNIYKMLDNADLKFPKVTSIQGESDQGVSDQGEIEISHGNFIHLLQNENRSFRIDVFSKFYKTYHEMRNTYAATLSSSVKNDVFSSKVRHYPSALQSSLFDDNVPLSVYDGLIGVINDKLPYLHRYMDLRKKAMKLDALHFYDLYVPLSSAGYDVDYETAKQMVLEGLQPLGKGYQEILRHAFDNRWVDVFENKGKTSGAYCWGCYGTHPYVLLNYQPNIDSVFTIAHEMGHAMHSYYSDNAQDYVNAQYKIILAEVASTVNETLLMNYLLNTETDKNKRLRLLNYYLEQFRTTVYRQVMFAEFEKIIHEYSENGGALTADYFESEYLELNRRYYGNNMEIDPLIGMEWARISHFYNAFYVYKYATGFSAAVAISRDILQSGETALNRYMQFLSSGGSDYPLEILKNAGVDLTSDKPVSSALTLFSDMLTQFESLL